MHLLSRRERIVVDFLPHTLLLLQPGTVAPSTALPVASQPRRFDLAFQLCGCPLLDANLGLNFSLVLQGLLCCNVLLETSPRQPAL